MASLQKCFTKYDTITETELWVFAGVAGFLAIVHIIMVRRTSDGGRIGVPTPMDNLSLTIGKKRILYCLVYGGATSGIVNLIFGGTVLDKDTDAFINIFVKILSFSVIGLLYYPIFISVTTATSLVGSFTGAVYTISFMAAKIAFISGCDSKTYRAAVSILNMPAFVCLVVVTVFLIFNFCRTLRNGLQGQGWVIAPEQSEPILEADENIWQVEHVRRLFRPVGSVPDVALTWRRRLRLQVHDPKQPFQYSLRTLIAIFMGLCLIFYLLVALIFIFIVLEVDIPNIHPKQKILENWLVVSVFVGGFLAAVLSISQLFFIAKHYRRDMLLMYRGQHSSQKDRVPAKRRFKALAPLHFTMYAGSQAALVALGFVYKWLLMAILCIIVASPFVVGQLGGSKRGATFFFDLASPFVAGGLLFLGQLIIVYFVFMVHRGKESLVINNRRLYSNFAYFVFFWNMMIGFISALLRVVISFLFSSIMVSRLSTPVVPSGYQIIDTGHNLYKNYLLMENELTNPSLVVFSRLLLAVNGRVQGETGYKGDERPGGASGFASSTSPVRTYGTSSVAPFTESRRARNRWLVAVTMLRNPSIVCTRRGDCFRGNADGDDKQPVAAASLQSGALRYEAGKDVEAMPQAYGNTGNDYADADNVRLIA